MPLLDTAMNALVSHADVNGVPCNEGTTQGVHAVVLGDYPHEELLSSTAWDSDFDDPDVAVTARPADPIAALKPEPPAVEPPTEDPMTAGPPISRRRARVLTGAVAEQIKRARVS